MRTLIALFLLGLTTTGAMAEQATLTWTDNADDEANFLVEKAVVSDPSLCATAIFSRFDASRPVDGVGGTGTYVDTTLLAGYTYCYRVAAENPLGPSSYSNIASISIPLPSNP